ncbi:MAG: HEAT repeat domain-containing protein [Gammaproteobacteria bacterium]|nr:HEAT repeat domain-containing protein [Gammaproteobacteria bacterium]
MASLRQLILVALITSISALSVAQTDDAEDLKISALEALISAPPERALPIVTKVLRGAGSAELKERALFVLSQIDLPEAQSLLVEMAETDDRRIRLEAIRMIGIGGDQQALAALGEIYAAGDADTREAVLEAYLIADDSEAVYQIAVNAENAEDFENAVNMLGAMGALDELRALRDRPDMADVLIDAYAVAGDVESLTALATDTSDPERQAQAIHGLGIAGGDEVGDVLVGIYRDTDVPKVKDAALEGLQIADLDRAVLELFNESTAPEEKRELLQTLVNMDSDAVWDVIDTTLENGE